MDTGTMWFCLFSDIALDDLQLMNGADAMLAGGQETVYVPTGESTVTAEPTSPQPGTSTGPARGFETINIEHMAATTSAYVMSQKSKSTLRKQKIVVGRFYEWLRSNNEMQKLEELSIGRIDQLLAFWLMDLKSVDGSDYEVGTLTSYLSSIKAYLKGLGHDVEKLDITKQVTTAKKKELKSLGKGNFPNRASRLSSEEEDRLWDTGAFGSENPESLLHGLWYLFTKGFGFRGRHEARQLRVGDVEQKCDSEGRAFLQWNERLTKTRNGSSSHHRPFAPRLFETPKEPRRCPVKLYNLYMSKRPAKLEGSTDAFWLTINPNFKRSANAKWYSDCPMGENRLANIMSRAARHAGLDATKWITNHSVRRTMCSQLYQAEIAPLTITGLSGHKSVNSLMPYIGEASDKKQRKMSNLLVNSGRDNSDETEQLAITHSDNPGSSNDAVPAIRAITASTPVSISNGAIPGAIQGGISENSTNVLTQQTRGLMGLMSNATFNGTVNININIQQ